MNKYSFYLIIFVTIQFVACAQNKSDNTMLKEFSSIKHYDRHPEYRLQVSNSNCSYEIEVNDMPLDNYFGSRGGTSGDLPLNTRILKSGRQRIKLKVYPPKGEILLNIYATMRLILVHYDDNKNYNGPHQELLNYSLSADSVKNKNYFEFNFTFDANVPYNQDGWIKGKDLTKVPDIEKKLLAKMEEMKKIVEERNTNAMFKEELQKRKERYEAFYATDSSITQDLQEDDLNETFKGLSNVNYTPNSEGKITYYANNKVITIKQWFDPDFSYGLVYKATQEKNNDFTGSFQFIFYMPEGSNELKVIR